MSMATLDLEYALNEASGFGIVGGPFYGIAGAIELALKDKNLTPDEKAKRLSEIIRSWLKDFQKQNSGEFTVMDTEQYAQRVKKSRITISKWANAGKIPNAYMVGNGKNKKWVIIVKNNKSN